LITTADERQRQSKTIKKLSVWGAVTADYLLAQFFAAYFAQLVKMKRQSLHN